MSDVLSIGKRSKGRKLSAGSSDTNTLANLTPDQIAEFKEAFDLFDVNQSGTIGFEELQTCMVSMGFNPNPEDIRKMIAEVDETGTGDLDFNEFCTLMARRMADDDDDDEVIAKQFEIFDRDNDGFVGPVEMYVVFQELGAELTLDEIDEIIRKGDVDGDGRLGFDDFARIMKEITNEDTIP